MASFGQIISLPVPPVTYLQNEGSRETLSQVPSASNSNGSDRTDRVQRPKERGMKSKGAQGTAGKRRKESFKIIEHGTRHESLHTMDEGHGV